MSRPKQIQNSDKIIKWTQRKGENQTSLEFYIEHREQYPPDITRSLLFSIDESLYRNLSRNETLEKAIPEADESAVAMGRKIGKWYSKFGNDTLAYYRKHYPGLTRGQLSKENPGLYQRLWKDRLLKHVPTKYNLKR